MLDLCGKTKMGKAMVRNVLTLSKYLITYFMLEAKELIFFHQFHYTTKGYIIHSEHK